MTRRASIASAINSSRSSQANAATAGVSDQARDAAYGIKNFAVTSGFPDFYVHALAWLTQVGAASLDGVDLTIVGQSDWRALLLAASGR